MQINALTGFEQGYYDCQASRYLATEMGRISPFPVFLSKPSQVVVAVVVVVAVTYHYNTDYSYQIRHNTSCNIVVSYMSISPERLSLSNDLF